MSPLLNRMKLSQSDWLGSLKSIAVALLIALVVRSLLFQPFNIPSGSMKPTLLVGDYLFVSKPAYGYSHQEFPWNLLPGSGRILASNPARGDVVVFRLPRDRSTDYIKRIIGLPGDEILVRHGIVYINGQAAPQAPAGTYDGPEEVPHAKPRYIETLPGGIQHYVIHGPREDRLDNVGPFRVPDGHYFMMGDNRDDSLDGRVPAASGGVGYVPFENLVGRADIVYYSAAVDDPKAAAQSVPWRWLSEIRWGRILEPLRS